MPQVDVDEAVLTGNSVPVTLKQLAKMGTLVVRGEAEATVQSTGSQTFIGRIATLAPPRDAEAAVQRDAIEVSVVLTAAAMLLSVASFAFLNTSLDSNNVKAATRFATAVLVAATPFALCVVCNDTLLRAPQELFAKKVIVTRLSAIEMMAAVKMLCTVKNGKRTQDADESHQQDCIDGVLTCSTFSSSGLVKPVADEASLDSLQRQGSVCAVLGGSQQDVPCLKRADVAIVVREGAADAALSAAHVVVMGDSSAETVVDSLLITRSAMHRTTNVLVFQMAASLQLVGFLVAALFVLSPVDYGASNTDHFFRVPVLLIVLIVLLHDGALLALGYDRVMPARRLLKRSTGVRCFVAAVLAVVPCISSLLLLWMSLDSIHDHEQSWYYKMGLPPADYPHIISATFLNISISDLLTLFSVRTQSQPFFASAPSKTLSMGVCALLATSTLVASLWPKLLLDDVYVVGLARLSAGQPSMTSQCLMPMFVWLYCVMWLFVQDWIKVLAYKFTQEGKPTETTQHAA